MTDAICTSLEQEHGIINAYSWPTGMRNEGPIEFGIYFNDTKTDPETVREALTDATTEHINGTAYLETTTQPKDQDNRTCEAIDPENTTQPMLAASVFVHPAGDALAEYLTTDTDVRYFNINWDPHGTGATWSNPWFLVERVTGTVEIFFELTDPSKYDETVDTLATIFIEETSITNPTVDVQQADADGYYLHISGSKE